MTATKKKVIVEKDLTVQHISQIHQKLLETLEENSAVEIDLGEVTDCDTAGVQLLVSLKKYASDHHTDILVQNASQAVTSVIDGYGIQLTSLINNQP